MRTIGHTRELLHVKEAASELDVHPSTLRRAIRRGELEAVRIGQAGRLRIRREALDSFLRPAHDETREE
jgi:excisionase family DNA binding protein